MSKEKHQAFLTKRTNDHFRETIVRIKALVRKLLAELEAIDLDRSTRGTFDFFEEVKRFEIALISSSLFRTKGDQLRAARLINLKRSTLNNKIKRYNIQLNAFSGDRDVRKAGKRQRQKPILK